MSYSKQVFLLFVFFGVIVLCSTAQDSDLSYLALGDSYTIGERVSASERWPVQLAKALRQKGVQIADPKIIAKTGWTCSELKQAIADAELSSPYDLVSLLIGVNDQYRGYDIEKYPENFRYLLEKAISLAGNNPDRVLVLSIPDYGVTPFGREKNPDKIARELQQYNSINESISDSLGVHYVDITPISKKAAKDTSLLASDQLHPSGKMYSQWVEKALPVMLQQLEK